MGLPLIYRPSPLVYPGGAAGFDPSHPLAGGAVRMSVVAANLQGQFTDLLHGKATTSSGTLSTLMHGDIGPSLQNTSGFALSGNPTTVDTTYTFAAIAVFTAPTARTVETIIQTSGVGGSTPGVAFSLYTPSSTAYLGVVYPGHAAYASTIAITAGVPYYLACNWFLSTGTAYLVATNLLTGAVQTATITGTTTSTGGTNGTYLVGSDFGGASDYVGGYIAAAMLSTATPGPRGILAAAQRPWDFWRPPTVTNLIFSSLTNPGPSVKTGVGSSTGSATAAAVGAMAGTGTVVFGPPTGLADFNNGLFNIRQFQPVSAGSSGQVAASFITGTGGTNPFWKCDHVSIAILGSATAPNVQNTPTELLFGGTSGFTATTSGEIVTSDFVTFPFLSTDTVVVIMDFSATVGSGDCQYGSNGAAYTYYIAGTSTPTWNITSGAALSGHTTGNVFGLYKILTQAAGGGVGTSVGTATALGVGYSLFGSVGTSTGSSTAPAVGYSLFGSVGTSTGSSTAPAVGTFTGGTTGTATSAGTATALGIGHSLFASVGTSTGSSTAPAVGSAGQKYWSDGLGVYALTYAGNLGTGTATGVTTSNAIGASIATGVGTSAGSSAALAIDIGLGQGIGTSAGTATAPGVGVALFPGAGTSTGSSTSPGVGASLFVSTGNSTGTATAPGVGSYSTYVSAGTSTGSATVSGIGASIFKGVGTSSGTATVLGYYPTKAVGAAPGSSTANAVGQLYRATPAPTSFYKLMGIIPIAYPDTNPAGPGDTITPSTAPSPSSFYKGTGSL